MKLSNILNLISAILTLLFVILLMFRSIKAGCFTWFDYGFAFSTLFFNLGISILAAVGR
jgi:hypothetical protein